MVSDSTGPSERTSKQHWIWLAIIVAVAAFFRLYELGLSAFRADTILLWELAKRQVPPSMIFTDWFEVSGAAGQMPMPAFIMQEFLSLFNWHITPAMVRFPFALFGVLTVPVAFFAGRRIRGPVFGLLFAALLALNSFHIATSREAYFYSTLVFGTFLFLLASAGIVPALWGRRAIGVPDLLILAGALFFVAYSQITGLILCATGGLLFFGLLVYRQRREGCLGRNLAALAAVYGVVLLPVVLASWGLRPILEQIGANKETAAKVVSMGGENLLSGTTKAFLQFAWGWSAAGWLFLIVALAGAVFVGARRRQAEGAWIVYFIVMQIAVFGVMRTVMVANYEARYMSGVFPFFLVFCAYGLEALPGWLADVLKKPGLGRAGVALLYGAVLIFSCYPAYLQTRLTGKPTPYFEISRWFDANLPRNTPVLVDRWFEPWNEFKSHPSTNVTYTFTIPNEPVDVYVKNRWRDTAMAFFERFPEAAYLEIAKSYWEAAGVGPWEWPRRHFARHVVIANEPGLKLRELGLANRADFYAANSNRIVVEIFYNTRDDILAKARAAGRKVVGLHGDGWAYTKTQDFRDWRVLEEVASLDVYNLTTAPLAADVVVRALSVSGSKKVKVSNGAEHTFSMNQMQEWNTGRWTLMPGLNKVVLTDALWQMAKVPLIVDEFSVREVPPETAQNSPAP